MTTHLLTVDPGLHKCGCAVFDVDRARLVLAWTSTRLSSSTIAARGPLAWAFMARSVLGDVLPQHTPYTLAIEVMQADQRTVGRKREDVMEVQGVVGAVTALYHERFRNHQTYGLRGYTPAQWKGQIPKKVMVKRLCNGGLKPEEMSATQGIDHNAWDAIGIGKHHLKTMGAL